MAVATQSEEPPPGADSVAVDESVSRFTTRILAASGVKEVALVNARSNAGQVEADRAGEAVLEQVPSVAGLHHSEGGAHGLPLTARWLSLAPPLCLRAFFDWH